MKKFILIDGSSVIYRAFYALPDTMKTASGIPTNAIYGFTSILLKIIDQHPDYIAIAFDLREPTFRHKEYPEYKATRSPQPPTLYEQLPFCREITKAFAIPVVEKAGFEADDIIGTLATMAKKQGLAVEILTGDKDAWQLIDKSVRVISPHKGISETETIDENKVIEKFGVTPNQIADWKGLKGDTSDNIPGVPGIGEKTATSLLQTYDSIESLIKNVDQISNEKLKDKIKTHVDLAKLSKKLATIVTDVPINISLADCQRQPLNWDILIPILKKFEFKSLLKKYAPETELTLFSPAPVDQSQKNVQKNSTKIQVIHNESDLKKLAAKIEKVTYFAVDTETNSVNPFDAKLVGLSLCLDPDQTFYLPFAHKFGKQLEAKTALEILKTVLESEKIKKIGHNIKFDIEVLANYGIQVKGIGGDSMLAAYVLDPTGGSKSLKFLVPAHLGYEMRSFEEVVGKENQTFEDVDINVAAEYAGNDARYTFELHSLLLQKLKDQNLSELYEKVEVPLLSVLAEMETFGTYVDCAKLKKLSQKLQADLKALKQDILILAGEEFNVNSTKQLQQILFHKLQLPIIKRTKTGISTDSEVLEALAPKFEIAQKLLDYRTISKLLSTYIEALPELVNQKTSRIHTSFNQAITATGRLSSSNPNLQNIPAKGKYAKIIREAFVAQKPGWEILAADYSQIELRILAHLSGDPELTRAFKEGKDIHTATAAAVNNLPLDEVTYELRSAAKAINFGIIYGMSDFGLSKQLGIKRQAAKEFIDRYFAKYSKVKEFIDQTIAAAREKGYVETMLGRRRSLLDINSQNPNQRQFAERTAINTPVQGTAADMIKVAMINLHKKLAGFKAKMILQVHDELVLELPKNEVAEIKKIVEEEMQNALLLDVPVKIDIGVGSSWAEAK